MDIEFHYYITYLIAQKAGFNNDEAYVIAYSSQYVDDNVMIFEINKDKPEFYSNYISQTMNILKPKGNLFRIYPLFHFIPGDPLSPGTARKDGKMHYLNTTPNSTNANRILDKALETKNLYRIGIASHGYTDTWAHQNFVGYFEEFNAMKGVLELAAPNIGHADAGHSPDWPALRWSDGRLLGNNARINNTTRFLDAAANIFKKYRLYLDSNCREADLNNDCNALLNDLAAAIGERDQENRFKDNRVQKYKELGKKPDYGNLEIPLYDDEQWMDAGVNESVRGLKDRSDFLLTRWDPFVDIYTWKDPIQYKNTHWYQFQEAVKNHQNEAWEILYETTFSKLDLESL